MKNELIIEGTDALDTSILAANTLDSAVGITLGPGGKTVGIRVGKGRAPVITKDGATVARKIYYGTPEVDLMINLFREAALNVEERVGDGTTTTTILTAAMVRLLKTHIDKHQLLPIHAIRSLAEEVKKFQAFIRESATPVVTKEDIYKVAYISTNSDDSIAINVAEAISQIGALGIFRVREGMWEDRVHFTPGYPTTMTVLDDIFLYGDNESLKLENALVLIYNSEATPEVVEEALRLMQQNEGQDLVLICNKYDEVDDLMLELRNRCKTAKRCFVPLRTSSYGKDRMGCNKDITFITNATESDTISELRVGVAESIEISKTATTVSFSKDISEYIEEVKAQQHGAKDNYDIERFGLRVSRLTGGICEIQVTGNTEADQIERVSRYDDALRAAQTALRSGSVKGGGFSYLDYLAVILANENNSSIVTEVMIPLLDTVFTRTLTNAGVSLETVSDHIEAYINTGAMFDVATGKTFTADTFAVVDPADTSYYAIETAMTLTKLTLNTATILMSDPSRFEVHL